MKIAHLLEEQDAGLEVTGKSGKLPPRGVETEKQNHVKRSTREQRQSIVAIVSRLNLVITLKALEDVTAYRDLSGVATDEQDSPRHRTPSISDVHVKLARPHEHVIQTIDCLVPDYRSGWAIGSAASRLRLRYWRSIGLTT